MAQYRVELRQIFEANGRAKKKIKNSNGLEHYFKNPIIHRQIHGEVIYVPLNLEKAWNQL